MFLCFRVKVIRVRVRVRFRVRDEVGLELAEIRNYFRTKEVFRVALFSILFFNVALTQPNLSL